MMLKDEDAAVKDLHTLIKEMVEEEEKRSDKMIAIILLAAWLTVAATLTYTML